MPGRPRKPKKIHELEGTAQKCRMQPRANELELPPETPAPPDWLTDPDALEEWKRLTEHARYAPCLSGVHTSMLATYCQMYGEFVAAKRARHPIPVTHILAMSALASKFGLTPADGTKVRMPEQKKAANKFAALSEEPKPLPVN